MARWLKQNFLLILLLTALPCVNAYADVETIPVLLAKPHAQGVIAYSLSIKILMVMAALTVLPALLMTMTAFTRIVIVLAIARQAIGISNVPSNQIIIGLSLIMTLFVMTPVLQKINEKSVQPYTQGKMDEIQAFSTAGDILKTFMLKQTRKTDLKLFTELSKAKQIQNSGDSMLVLIPAFITSELKMAFEIGFFILLPFLIIDIVVSTILMSMGMMMLSPMVISLPFKILFFVLVDGWSLLITSLITSFRV